MEERIGRYTIERLLARGGMAEVFLARADGPAGFSKQVVIKRILPEFIEDARFVKMFLDEARLAALLNHPNIVQVFDFGEEKGVYYLAMEYIEGESIRRIIRHYSHKDNRIEPRVAAHLMVGACEGLQYAHHLTDANGVSYNVIHRDVSPDNILVSTSGITKVVDFGIAKAAVNSTRTEAGVVKGKYSYMSPELIRGEGIDRRVDVYALGVTLYEALTGRRPFQADNELQLLRVILHTKPEPAIKVNPDVPFQLSEIVALAMHPDPACRYPDASAFQSDLEDFLAQGKPRVSAVDIAHLVKIVHAERKGALSPPGTPSGPKGIPGFPVEGVNSARNAETRPAVKAPALGLDKPAEAPAASPPPLPPATELAPPPKSGAGANQADASEPAAATAVGPQRPEALEQASPSLAEEPIAPLAQPRPVALPVPEAGLDAGELQAIRQRPAWIVPASVIGGLGLAGLVIALVLKPSAPTPVPTVPVAPQPAQPAQPMPAPPIVPTPAPAPPTPAPVEVQPKPEPVAPVLVHDPAPVVAEPKPTPPVAVAPKAQPTPAPKPATPTPSPAPSEVAGGPGFLTLRSEPWCDVSIDGAHAGTTPLVHVSVASGKHLVVLRNDAYGAHRELALTVKSGEELKQTVAFALGRLVVHVQPWANVSVDGRAVGTTPFEPVELAAGAHEIRLVNAELSKDERRRVVIAEGKDAVLKIVWE